MGSVKFVESVAEAFALCWWKTLPGKQEGFSCYMKT